MCLLTTSLNISTHTKDFKTVSEDTEKHYRTTITHKDEVMVIFTAKPGGIYWEFKNDDFFKLVKDIENAERKNWRIPWRTSLYNQIQSSKFVFDNEKYNVDMFKLERVTI